jgi:hypothetical protein
MDLSEQQMDKFLLALSHEGFALPFMARSRDYETPSELHAADEQAWKQNKQALQKAIREAEL